MIIKFFDCNEVVLSDEIPSRSQYTERIYVNRLNNFIWIVRCNTRTKSKDVVTCLKIYSQNIYMLIKNISIPVSKQRGLGMISVENISEKGCQLLK